MAPELVRAQERRFSGHKSAEFAHDRHQLLQIVDGAASIQNNFGRWSVPTNCAAWIPAGMRHSIEASAARARTLYISRAPAGISLRAGAVFHAAPLLRALVDHICRLEVLRADDRAAKRLASVLLDQIAGQRQLPLFVPALRSPLAQRVAAALQADPADTPRIRDLAQELGVSDRTIERAFVSDVSMTVGEYRQRVRTSRAIALLAAGGEVKDVALEVGYETPSAFIVAFKKYTGVTPGAISRS